MDIWGRWRVWCITNFWCYSSVPGEFRSSSWLVAELQPGKWPFDRKISMRSMHCTHPRQSCFMVNNTLTSRHLSQQVAHSLVKLGTFQRSLEYLYLILRTVGRLREVLDKGKAAAVTTIIETKDIKTGKVIFENQSTVFIRGAGGFGGKRTGIGIFRSDKSHIRTQKFWTSDRYRSRRSYRFQHPAETRPRHYCRGENKYITGCTLPVHSSFLHISAVSTCWWLRCYKLFKWTDTYPPAWVVMRTPFMWASSRSCRVT